jgi:hypothetical protein
MVTDIKIALRFSRCLLTAAVHRRLSLDTGVAFLPVYQKRSKREEYNDRHFDVKLALEFFDAKLIIWRRFDARNRL